MKRLFVLAYSAAAYLLFLAVSAWTIAWLVDVRLQGLPAETIDGAATVTPVVAIAVDLLLILGFGLQHSVMARPGFKRWWTQWVPPEVERSTYVLLASGFLPPMARSNCSTFGRSNCSRQDGRIMRHRR